MTKVWVIFNREADNKSERVSRLTSNSIFYVFWFGYSPEQAKYFTGLKTREFPPTCTSNRFSLAWNQIYNIFIFILNLIITFLILIMI